MVTPTFCISLNFFPKSLGIIDTEGKKNNNNNNNNAESHVGNTSSKPAQKAAQNKNDKYASLNNTADCRFCIMWTTCH